MLAKANSYCWSTIVSNVFNTKHNRSGIFLHPVRHNGIVNMDFGTRFNSDVTVLVGGGFVWLSLIQSAS